MIYEYLEQAKNDLKWLLTSPSVITNDISTLSTLKINSLIEDLTSCDDSYLKNIKLKHLKKILKIQLN